MGVNKKNYAHGTLPEYGAIFMSNSVTIRECFKRKLFGLPYWLEDFVLQIKPGMILFLFEYEKRVLHGVFRAISDGAMNIVPHAYSSSGQQFPAQVKFSILWCCNPLSENQFRNAIEENYFSAKKFNFGLSKMQVHRLLSLFSLTKFSDQLHPRQLRGDSFECSGDYLIDESQSVADVNVQILNEGLQGKLMEGEDQVNTRQESATLPHYNIRNIIPPSESSAHYSLMDNRNFTYNSGSQSNAQIMRPSLQSQSDCMTSMPFQTSICLENITVPSVSQSQINVSCSDPNLHSLPTQEFEDEGSSRRSIITSDDPSHALSYSLSPYQNEQVLARQESREADYLYVPKAKEFPIQLPPDSVKISSMPSIEQTAANHGDVCYENSESKHSDRERKVSVFSRLTYPSDASIQEFNDYADYEKLFLDPSVDEVMSVLERHHWQWEEANHKVLNQEHNIGRNFMKKKWAKSSSSSYSNCFQVSDELWTNIEDSIDELRTNFEDSIDDNSNHIAIEIPFVNFKRRRKPWKVENNAPTGGENVNVENVQLSGVQQKRRKLIRPSIFYNELRDSGDTNSVSPSLRDTPKDSLLRERASSDQIIEMDKTEKLCQAAEFPDIIWLVDDEEEYIGSETVATVEDCCGSTRNGSEDRTVSSIYVSNLHITSKDLGVKESCSSTHKYSTSEDHMASQNLNNSGLCSRQELSLEEGSEPNAGNSVIRVNEGSNEKEIVINMQIDDEPYQGCTVAAMTKSSDKSSSPLNSAPESAPEEVIERRNHDNEISLQIVDEPYQGCAVAVMTESSDKSSSPLDSAPESISEEAIERRKQDNEISMQVVDEPYQGCAVAVMTESSDKSSSPLDSAPESVPEEVIERKKQDNEISMQIVDEYQGCAVAVMTESSDKSSSPLDSAPESVVIEEAIERRKQDNETSMQIVDESYQGCAVAVMTESSDKSSSPLDSAPESVVIEEAIERRKQDNETSMQIVDEYQGCAVAVMTESSDKSSSPLDSAPESVVIEEAIERRKQDNETSMQIVDEYQGCAVAVMTESSDKSSSPLDSAPESVVIEEAIERRKQDNETSMQIVDESYQGCAVAVMTESSDKSSSPLDSAPESVVIEEAIERRKQDNETSMQIVDEYQGCAVAVMTESSDKSSSPLDSAPESVVIEEAIERRKQDNETSMQIVDEYQGCAVVVMTESSDKSSSPLDSAPESVVIEEAIERRKQDNETSMQIVDESYQGCAVAVMTESSDKSSSPLDSAPESVVIEEAIERRKQDNETSMQIVDESYQGCAVAVMTESSDKSSSPLDSAPESVVIEEAIERRKQDNETSMQIIDEYQGCAVAVMTESSDKSSSPLDSAPESVVIEEAIARRKQDNETSMQIVDEYQGCAVAVMTESSDKSSSPLDSAPESVVIEEAIERRKQDNEISMQIVDESYQGCAVAVMIESSDKSSNPLDSTPEGVLEEAIEGRVEDNENE